MSMPSEPRQKFEIAAGRRYLGKLALKGTCQAGDEIIACLGPELRCKSHL